MNTAIPEDEIIRSQEQEIERLKAENERRALVMLSLRDAVNEYHRAGTSASLDEINRLAETCNQGKLLDVPYVASVIESQREEDKRTIERLTAELATVQAKERMIRKELE